METGRVLTSAKVSDYNTFDKPTTVQLAAFAGAKKRGDELAVTLPAKSVFVL